MCRFAGLVLALCIVLGGLPSGQVPLRPFPEALAAAPAELVDRLRADPFTYFRFINRAWTARVCEAFADVTAHTYGTTPSGQLDSNRVWDIGTDGVITPGPVPGYPTTVGYDLTTGWGVPAGPAYVSALVAAP